MNEIILFMQTKVLVSIEKCETEISLQKGLEFPSTKHTQFPLTKAWASTVHQFEGLSCLSC